MSEKSVKALKERLEGDTEFRRKLDQAPTTEKKVQIIKSAGLASELSDDELQQVVVQIIKSAGLAYELSDEELEQVVGGSMPGPPATIQS